jgi:hypothetical protein
VARLLHLIDELADSALMVTPLSHRRFRIANTQEQRVIISFEDEDGHRPLQREQFESLYDRIRDEPTAFALDRLPPDADPYPAVLTLHPRYEINGDEGTITVTGTNAVPSLLDPEPEPATRKGAATSSFTSSSVMSIVISIQHITFTSAFTSITSRRYIGKCSKGILILTSISRARMVRTKT